MSRIAFVSFDVTNTLLKFRYAPGTAYTRVALQYGLKLNEEDVSQAFKRNYKQLWTKYPNFGYESIGCRKFWCHVVSSTLTEAGCEANAKNGKLLNDISNHLYDAFATDEFWKLNDAGVEVIEKLKSQNLKLIVISNTDERLMALLKTFKLLQYFDVVVSSYETGFVKPDRRIFDCALSRIDTLKCLNAKSAAHIGDDFELDYKAARNAGWNALWLNEKNEPKDIPQRFVLTKLLEIPSRIQLLPCDTEDL